MGTLKREMSEVVKNIASDGAEVQCNMTLWWKTVPEVGAGNLKSSYQR